MLRQDVELSDEAQARGGCLTGWLVLLLIGAAGSLVRFIAGVVSSGIALGTDLSFQVWILVEAVLFLSILVFLVAIWKWRKWGVLGLVAAVTIGTAINLYAGTRILYVLVPLIKIGVLVVLVRPRWHLFKWTRGPLDFEIPDQARIAH